MRSLIEPLEPDERLSDDDMSSRREQEFLADALQAHRTRAARHGECVRGVCRNCGEQCSPLAVYCDADCRADHEARVAALDRLGTA